ATGLDENRVNIGDLFQVGSAVVRVTQPRMPCYKLGIKFGRDDIIKRFLDSGRTGFYFAVQEEGEVKAGDPVELLRHDPGGVTVADVTRLYAHEKNNLDLLRRVVDVRALPENWRGYFRHRLENLLSTQKSAETFD